MNSTEFDYDVVVIGTGPGGEGAAMQAVKGGHRVVVVEKYHFIGGGCTHWGTIPSKALRYSISAVMRAINNPTIREMGVHICPSMQQLRSSSQAIIQRQVAMRQSFYDRNGVPIHFGEARFVDPQTVEVDGTKRITGKYFVIATGSRPYRPENIDFTHPRIFDSDTILSLDNKPQSVTVYGAGVIGCEYASMFRNLEMKVNLINTRAKLLEFLDDEIIDALAYHLRDQGILIRHNEMVEGIEGQEDGVVVHLKSGKRLKTDIFLWANGRQGNTETLGLEQIGIEVASRGQIKVNEHFQTSSPHIYAVGDVIGYPSLASAAYSQGRFAAMHMLGTGHETGHETGHGAGHGTGYRPVRVEDIPTGIYTSPEISSVGKTERELTAACIPYEIGFSQFKSLARAQITGETTGMLKLLFHRDTLEILGVHCFGAQAAEIVHIGQAIMSQPQGNNTLEYFFETTFNYPTMAEAYRVAALNGYNRLF